MNSNSLKKQMRMESILLSLSKLDYLTQTQIQSIHDLKSPRNANRILNSMSDYLSSFRLGLEKVYYLNKNGREFVNQPTVRKKTPNVEHFLTRNQLWIYMQRPKNWKNEAKVIVGDSSIVCDAQTYQGNIPVFIEVDISQSMQVNKQKIQKYRKLKELSKEPFYVVWVTKIDSRRKRISELSQGLPGYIYTLEEII